MKVIGINGSSRKDGNTAIIIRTIFEELNKRGIETEFIQLADVDIEPCRACFACKGKGNCVFRKDGFAEVFSKIVGADGIILGSPVYSGQRWRCRCCQSGNIETQTGRGSCRRSSCRRYDGGRYNESFFLKQGDDSCWFHILEHGLWARNWRCS